MSTTRSKRQAMPIIRSSSSNSRVRQVVEISSNHHVSSGSPDSNGVFAPKPQKRVSSPSIEKAVAIDSAIAPTEPVDSALTMSLLSTDDLQAIRSSSNEAAAAAAMRYSDNTHEHDDMDDDTSHGIPDENGEEVLRIFLRRKNSDVSDTQSSTGSYDGAPATNLAAASSPTADEANMITTGPSGRRGSRAYQFLQLEPAVAVAPGSCPATTFRPPGANTSGIAIPPPSIGSTRSSTNDESKNPALSFGSLDIPFMIPANRSGSETPDQDSLSASIMSPPTRSGNPVVLDSRFSHSAGSGFSTPRQASGLALGVFDFSPPPLMDGDADHYFLDSQSPRIVAPAQRTRRFSDQFAFS
jgi:hypothetical protein